MEPKRKRNTGDYVVIVEHEDGETTFGPLFHRHTDPRKNVYDFMTKAKLAGYTVRQEVMFSVAAFESFTEDRAPRAKVSL